MKKAKFILSVLAAVMIAGGAYAGSQDFILENNTNHTVLHVYISPSDSGVWGPDRLSGVLYSGNLTAFTFTNCHNTFYDIKIVYSDDKPDVVFSNVNMLETWKIVLTDNARGGTNGTRYTL